MGNADRAGNGIESLGAHADDSGNALFGAHDGYQRVIEFDYDQMTIELFRTPVQT